MLEVADVLQQHGPTYLDTHGTAVPRQHQRVIRDLIACRTAQLGGHLYECDRCDHQRYAYHSCRNRHCPKCHGNDRWIPARKDYLVPVRALSRLFRGIFMQHAKQLLPGQKWPTCVWKQDWVVYAKPTVQRPDAVLTYLGRYVHRIAITNSRILSVDNGRVTFRYRRVNESRHRTMTLSAHEFIRRFRQHVLPTGLHKVRYYGLWAPANRKQLRRLREDLGQHGPSESREPSESLTQAESHPTDRHDDDQQSPPRSEPLRCPKCHEGRLHWVARIPPGARDPPTT